MHEGSFFEANIDKGGLHSRENPDHLAHVGIPGTGVFGRVFNLNFSECTVFGKSDSSIDAGSTNKDLLTHLCSGGPFKGGERWG